MDLKQYEIDCEYMKRALELAIKGEGAVSPNPMVGCVVVKYGKIIGEGYHMKYGEWHAERNALHSCEESAEGATLYVTLEPCCHYGKTPPCTEAIIENKISRVVIGSKDDNPLVDNKGIRILKEHGIEVTTGILENECRKVNEIFFHYISTKRPYVAMKYAMTLDGKIATYTGDSKWITRENAREHVHKIRNRYSAIMVGIGTVLADNPMLNCRIENGHNPIRIICDSNLRIPLNSNIVESAKEIRTIIACIELSDKEKISELEEKGVEIIKIPANSDGNVDLEILFMELGKIKIDSVYVEGGHTIHGELINNNLVNRVYSYISPKIIGGDEAPGPVGGNGKSMMKEAIKLNNIEIINFGEDVLITGSVN